MKKNECQRCKNEKNKTLQNATKACSVCSQWMLDCEAKWLLSLDLKQRRDYLSQVEIKRGKKSVEILRAVFLTLWQKKRADRGGPAQSHESKK